MPACSATTTRITVVPEPEDHATDGRHALGPLRIRPLDPAEDAPIRRVFAALSPRSRFLRYQRAARLPSVSMVRALVDLRPGVHVALVAEINDEPVGIVRWIRHRPDFVCAHPVCADPVCADPVCADPAGTDPAGTDPAGIDPARANRTGPACHHAELAVEVIDLLQSRGIGRRLAAAAARSALDAGIDCFTCWVDAQHDQLRRRLLTLGARVVADDPDQFRLPPSALLRTSDGRTAALLRHNRPAHPD